MSADLKLIGKQISKLLERVISKQLVKYLKNNNQLSALQSAYRANLSTEMTVLKVLANILLALDSGDRAMLALHELPAAFDRVDHSMLFQPLQASYGLNGVGLHVDKRFTIIDILTRRFRVKRF